MSTTTRRRASAIAVSAFVLALPMTVASAVGTAPTFSPNSGTYTAPAEDVSVTVAFPDTGGNQYACYRITLPSGATYVSNNAGASHSGGVVSLAQRFNGAKSITVTVDLTGTGSGTFSAEMVDTDSNSDPGNTCSQAVDHDGSSGTFSWSPPDLSNQTDASFSFDPNSGFAYTGEPYDVDVTLTPGSGGAADVVRCVKITDPHGIETTDTDSTGWSSAETWTLTATAITLSGASNWTAVAYRYADCTGQEGTGSSGSYTWQEDPTKTVGVTATPSPAGRSTGVPATVSFRVEHNFSGNSSANRIGCISIMTPDEFGSALLTGTTYRGETPVDAGDWAADGLQWYVDAGKPLGYRNALRKKDVGGFPDSAVVEVSGSAFALAPGESATFQVWVWDRTGCGVMPLAAEAEDVEWPRVYNITYSNTESGGGGGSDPTPPTPIAIASGDGGTAVGTSAAGMALLAGLVAAGAVVRRRRMTVSD